MRNAFIDTVTGAFKKRDDLFIVSGDGGLGVFDDFKETHPDRFLNLGVAEQNMASFSAGLSVAGFKVFMYNIIPFLLYRCYEQVRNDICYQELPVVLVGIGSGISYAPQGMTHYSVEDLGITQTLPNLTVLSPIDPVEARIAADYALCADKPVYVRLPKRGEPLIHTSTEFDITKPQVIENGNDVAIIFHGSIADEVIDAGVKLKQDGIRPLLLSVPMIQPLNIEALLDMVDDMKLVVVVEEHFENCGLGNIIKTIYASANPSWSLKTLGLPFSFIHEVKNTKGMREFSGISASDIVRTVKEFLK
ncbi:MAG: transketolase [Nitrospirae bacterium]|nr:transketolase [Nitrospirota bacterium]